MIQDTELLQEVALFATCAISLPNGEEKLVCFRYSDGPKKEDTRIMDPTQSIMDIRNSYYCVSIPGESQWVKDYDRSRDSALDVALQDMDLEDSTSSGNVPERYPFQGIDHFAVVVKTHSSDISVGVTDTVEVIGVLGASDNLLYGDSFDLFESSRAPSIPTVHAILMRKVEDHGHPELSLTGHPEASDLQHYVKEAESIRKDLIQYIASAVHGDQLAAELVLLHFLARVYVSLKNICHLSS
ncbi:hypothetical protein BC939DRAFT_276344 [Gamsiella multidivaricata]|uniref:uncharacterized protein n=1 Tax=Gamsiella multidivaricata TaxID=101098 RepID=UPI002220F845|nr:uncharacterized protein BC939DRAFT_276344 [Gamsiella multidivaricata]KAI7818851.1 hypothetical protein BC939DRAFT_276344 [Gamsiella multidivaricata]